MLRFLLAASLTMSALFAGCSSDDHHGHSEDRPAVCKEIGERCHPFDNGAGVAHSCHASAHEAWTAAQCDAEKAKCFAACTATDAGGDTATDVGTDAAVDTGTGADAAETSTTSDASDAG